MTENQFWYDFEDVNGHKIVDFKNDKKYSLETIGDFREVVDLLNELAEENEELKADNNRLVNETAKIIAEHQRKVFDLIDEKIKEADEYFKQSYDSWYQGKFDVLTELKKELQE